MGKMVWLDCDGPSHPAKEIEFVKTQYALELQRKEADKDIVKASVLMTKVLISDKNKDGRGHLAGHHCPAASEIT